MKIRVLLNCERFFRVLYTSHPGRGGNFAAQGCEYSRAPWVEFIENRGVPRKGTTLGGFRRLYSSSVEPLRGT